MPKIKLYQLESDLKYFSTLFIIVLTIGVSLGLYYVYQTTSLSKEKINQRYTNFEKVVEDDFGIEEESGKSNSEILMTVHNHTIGFSIFFFLIGILFSFTTVLSIKIKMFIMVEPMVSIITTFGSIFLIRYYPTFLFYILLISSTLMYLCFYTMAFFILYELLFKKEEL